MFLLKDDKITDIKNTYKRSYFCMEIGLSKMMVYNIINRKKHCSKTTAYAFTKAIDKNAELSEYFEEI